MPQLAISRDFLPEYARLDRAVQTKVDDVFIKFTHQTHAGIHLEKMTGAIDPRVRTIRIDDHYRGIVMAPDTGQTYLLVRVLTHDQSDKWVARHRFGVNQATGALEIQDVVAIEEVGSAFGELSTESAGVPLFADRQRRDFIRLGIPESLVPILQRIVGMTELEVFVALLPQGQADALQMLAAGYTVEDAWAELVAGEDPGVVDTADLEGALGRGASQSMFHVVHGGDELKDILSRPFDLWRIFLHPSQRRLAYRDRYSGPVRVTGGAGTGKTVVAIHRAKFLADLGGSGPILLTTFTRNLAAAIGVNLRLLGGPALAESIEVTNIDRLAYRVVRETEGAEPKVADDEEQVAIWEDVVDELGLTFSPTFLRQEWLHVVLSQGISARDAYFTAPRPGRGVRLNRRQRAEVWKAVEQFANRLVERGKRTHLQLADAAAAFLAARSIRPYSHVVVDESQDLHPAQWRMLRAAVPEGPNDMFLVGDAHQRIYRNRVALSKVGINVRGRSHRLRINYRTTQEILAWSVGLLGEDRFDDLDDGTDTLAGYYSRLHGGEPTVVAYPSRAAELEGLLAGVQSWMASGVACGDIGVASRTGDVGRAAVEALRKGGIDARILTTDTNGGEAPMAVAVGTMHRMKGLEYRCVAVLDVGHDRVPLAAAMTAEGVDPLEHALDLQRERCLVYVACTRARDDLHVSWSGRASPFLESLI